MSNITQGSARNLKLLGKGDATWGQGPVNGRIKNGVWANFDLIQSYWSTF